MSSELTSGFMELRVLGPLAVLASGADGTPTAPKLRKLLALLLVHADQVIPVSSLAKELWDDEPPQSKMTTLQTYILHLRKLLASLNRLSLDEVALRLLVTKPGGYAFHSNAAWLDLHEFEGRFAAGKAAFASGQDAQAARELESALGLWHGPALADVPVGRMLESRIRELHEWRLIALQYLVEAQLRLGMYHEVVPKLAGLTVEHPLHEELHGLYMVSLHLSGRRAQALEVFHHLRHTLVRELGLEPAPHLQDLQRAILNGEPDIAARTRLGSPIGASRVNLPAAAGSNSAFAVMRQRPPRLGGGR